MQLQTMSGLEISRFFLCKYEREQRIPLSVSHPQLFGKIIEKAYSLRELGRPVEDIINITLNAVSRAKSLNIKKENQFLEALFNKILSLPLFNKSELIETNALYNDHYFAVEIDQVLRKNRHYYPREVKAYSGPSVYAWNSDLMQLTTQCIVLENYYSINSRYGEIVYLGSNSMIPVDTYILRKYVFYARDMLFKGHHHLRCETCKKLKLNKCSF